MKHKVENLVYSGEQYCYCRGILNCDIDGKHYTFDTPFWESGGHIITDHEGMMYAEKGDWLLNENYIPESITKEMAEEVIEAMNNDYMIERPCCGGCL